MFVSPARIEGRAAGQTTIKPERLVTEMMTAEGPEFYNRRMSVLPSD